MAVQQYGSGPYRAPTSTANNQNTAAQQNQQSQQQQPAQWQDQYSTGMGMNRPPQQQQSQPSNPWQITPNYGQQGNQYTSAWGNSAPSARQQTGPYNPNTTPGQQPPRPTPYTPGQRPGPWTPQAPAPAPYTPYTPSGAQSWPNSNNTAGAPLTPADFNTQALRDQYTAYMQANLPYLQYMQNNSQYSQDFNEAARRFDTQSQWQQQMDQYNMGLTGRQQTMAEWQQQEAANQWGAQFGQQQSNDLFSQDLANRQYGLEDRRLGGDQWYQQQQVQLQGQAQQIEQAYNEGRLSNEGRSIALAELTQQQNDAYRNMELQQQMAWAREQQANALGFDREELAATTGYRQQQDELARWQMQQQMQQQVQMQQAELEAQRSNAILQATGRAAGQGPNANWMRRF